MTTNTTPYGKASASTTLGGAYGAYVAFDHIGEFIGWVAEDNNPGWLQYQFQSGIGIDAKAIIDEYHIVGAPGGYSTSNPKSWVLLASNTGLFSGEEVLLDTQSNVTSWVESEPKSFFFTNTTGYYFYRLVISENYGFPYLMISELELFGAFAPEDNTGGGGIGVGTANMLCIGC